MTEPARFALNEHSLELHDSENLDPRCQYTKIKAKRYYGSLGQAMRAAGGRLGFCYWCLREWATIRAAE